MRTKVLLCAAALAAGALTSMAQSNVYSLNVVGYINLSLVEGFNMVANQLDVDGTGTNNTIAGVFSSNVPVGTTVYTFDPVKTTYNIAPYATVKGVTKWQSDFPLNPGQGCWVQIPAGGGAVTVTTVGNVLQGSLTNPNLPAGGGYTLVSSQIPLAGKLQTGLNYQPQVGEIVYAWDPVGKVYNINSYANIKGVNQWTPTEPSIAVGQGFWLSAKSGSSWKTNFTVQ